MTEDEAIDIVAKQLVRSVVSAHISDQWECYPEIGEDDWERVVQKAVQFCPASETVDRFRAAYELLEQRAGDEGV